MARAKNKPAMLVPDMWRGRGMYSKTHCAKKIHENQPGRKGITGSGSGVENITNGQVNFAEDATNIQSDSPASSAQKRPAREVNQHKGRGGRLPRIP